MADDGDDQKRASIPLPSASAAVETTAADTHTDAPHHHAAHVAHPPSLARQPSPPLPLPLTPAHGHHGAPTAAAVNTGSTGITIDTNIPSREELMVTDADDSGEDIDVHTEAALHERAPPTPAPLHREVMFVIFPYDIIILVTYDLHDMLFYR
jgi:hypothetical protein